MNKQTDKQVDNKVTLSVRFKFGQLRYETLKTTFSLKYFPVYAYFLQSRFRLGVLVELIIFDFSVITFGTGMP